MDVTWRKTTKHSIFDFVHGFCLRFLNSISVAVFNSILWFRLDDFVAFYLFPCSFGRIDYTLLHYTTLSYTTLHSPTLHSPTLHYTLLYYSILLHYSTFSYTVRSYSLHSLLIYKSALVDSIEIRSMIISAGRKIVNVILHWWINGQLGYAQPVCSFFFFLGGGDMD